MADKEKPFKSRLVLSISPVNPILDTEKLFDHAYRESSESPIDEFLVRLQAINKLSPQPNAFDAYQGQLVLLGVIAAVESYFRTLFRRLITFDPVCQEVVENRDISFSAAIHLKKEMLPEAMLERISFISVFNIKAAIKDLLGVSGNVSSELTLAMDDYVRVCQLRHCAVHRFGKLGVSNAISLGMEKHKSLLEKPLLLDYTSLQNIIAIATCLVKTLNDFLFNEFLSRIPRASWKEKYVNDRKLFISYYNIFCLKNSSYKSAPPKQIYDLFIKQLIAGHA
jgi:hypothetical protein